MNREILAWIASAFLTISAAIFPLVTHASTTHSDNKSTGHEHPAKQALAPTPSSGHSIYQLESKWRDDRNTTVPISSLRGRPVVMVMIYTTCQYVCPLLVEDVKQIEAALDTEDRKRVIFALISFDSQRDTPEQLAAYRKKRNLGRDNWVLLSGQPDEVLELSAVLGVQFRPDGRGEFLHSNLITVLDAEGVIRHQQVGIANERDKTTTALHKLFLN